MPETPHHAFELTISLADHVTETMREEVKAYMKEHCLWWAIKAEEGENGKVHLHGFLIFERSTRGSNDNAGAKTISNLRRSLTNNCKTLGAYLVTAPSKFAMVLASGKSDVFVAEYLQKEAQLTACFLPEDLQVLSPYFSDMMAEKPSNPEYARWITMYKEEEREYPCTFESLWSFFSYHMTHYDPTKQFRIPMKKADIAWRCEVLQAMINQTDLPLPGQNARNTQDHMKPPRVCPRCIEKGRDIPNELEPRKQFCNFCVGIPDLTTPCPSAM